jgi:histidinol phosphatase-like PHP family hydrolase
MLQNTKEEIVMILNSDFHIHSECSYDASNPLDLIIENAKNQGLTKIGITDHLNFNDGKFVGDILNSVKSVKAASEKNPFLILGVELTPIELPEFEYIRKTGTRDGYVAPMQDTPYGIELAMTKDELKSLGIRYAIGAAHWRVDVPNGRALPDELEPCIREWYRQQMWLACDDRITILGHPWYHGKGLWYQDFSVIPQSMHNELASALKENGKYAECNGAVLLSSLSSEKYKRQYAEYLRYLFECGIKITYGSDSHNIYRKDVEEVEKYLSYAGFRSGDIV